MPRHGLNQILDLDDFDRAAKQRLPRAVYGYVAHGSETESSLRHNRQAFNRWRLATRVLAGVKERSQDITLFGERYSAPFGIAPMGGSGLVAYEGHTVMARAAAEANVPFILSANSVIPLEEVAKANPRMWFAAYQTPDEMAIHGMIDRLKSARVGVLVITADVPVGSNREADARNGFSFPIRPGFKLGTDVAMHPRWAASVLVRTFIKRKYPHIDNLEYWGGPGLFSRKVAGIAGHPGLSWDHISLIRKNWPGKLVIKGILSDADVRIARERGADGVILSNHGGRQLDYAVAPVEMLSKAVEKAAGMTVMVDSGFRRGTDIVKALALGANAVFIGRPFVFAASYAGKQGVAHAIALLKKELDKDMGMLGIRQIPDITREILFDNGTLASGP